MKSAKEVLKQACERCEIHSAETPCEVQQNCPVYNLYLAATKRKRPTPPDDSYTYQGQAELYFPKPEMI